jgi:CheY-like chemotaxis protein
MKTRPFALGGGATLRREVDKPVRVLVVEDEPKMAGLRRRGLAEEGYGVDVAADGLAGFGVAAGRDYDAVVLDVMLPGLSGFEVCRRLRHGEVWVPVLMVTARDAVGDRICGLDGGVLDDRGLRSRARVRSWLPAPCSRSFRPCR